MVTPQGSVLGPLLFLICINNLNDDIKCLTLKFANDTKIFQFKDSQLGGFAPVAKWLGHIDAVDSWLANDFQYWEMQDYVHRQP